MSPDGRFRATADRDGGMQVWHVLTSMCVGRRAGGSPVRALAFDGSARWLAGAIGEIDSVVLVRAFTGDLGLAWSRRHGTVHFSGSGDPWGYPDEEREGLALAVAWCSDGAVVSVGEGEEAGVWDAATGARLATHEVDGWTHTTAVAASPAGWIVTGDARGGVRLFAPRVRMPVDQAAIGAEIRTITIGADDLVTLTTADGVAHAREVRDRRLVSAARPAR